MRGEICGLRHGVKSSIASGECLLDFKARIVLNLLLPKGFSMKHILTLSALLLLTSSTFAAPLTEPIEQCLEGSRQWIFRYLSSNPSDATRLAIDFCGAGGQTACLEPSQKWVYANTGRTPIAAAQIVLNFCKRGDMACLEPARQWIYRNSGGSPAQAAELAIKTCSDRRDCESSRRVRPFAPLPPLLCGR